jgi:hypothetical protein
MDVTHVARHRVAAIAAVVLFAAALALLLYSATAGARLEVVLAALGCIAGASVVSLLSR